MDMFGFGVDLNGRATQPIEGPAHIGVKVGLDFREEASFTVFGREDQVSINFRE